jgi:hypothetical protein
VLLMRDVYPLTIPVGYQFHTRWPGGHVMYLRKRSPLSGRILRTLRSMPLDHPAFKEKIVDQARPACASSLPPCCPRASEHGLMHAVVQGTLASCSAAYLPAMRTQAERRCCCG